MNFFVYFVFVISARYCWVFSFFHLGSMEDDCHESDWLFRVPDAPMRFGHSNMDNGLKYPNRGHCDKMSRSA